MEHRLISKVPVLLLVTIRIAVAVADLQVNLCHYVSHQSYPNVNLLLGRGVGRRVMAYRVWPLLVAFQSVGKRFGPMVWATTNCVCVARLGEVLSRLVPIAVRKRLHANYSSSYTSGNSCSAAEGSSDSIWPRIRVTSLIAMLSSQEPPVVDCSTPDRRQVAPSPGRP